MQILCDLQTNKIFLHKHVNFQTWSDRETLQTEVSSWRYSALQLSQTLQCTDTASSQEPENTAPITEILL